MHSLQFCKKKYEYPTLNMLWDIREILLFIFKTVDSRRSGLKGSFQKKDYWLHQLRNKKVRNSQLLIFEKNGLVWPADIWLAHFFQILKVRKSNFFYCVADVAKCLNPVFSISYLSLQNGNFLNFFHAQLQSICYVAVCIQSIPKYLKNFNFSIQCTKHIRTKTYLRLHIFSCISICIICICKQNTTANMNTEDFWKKYLYLYICIYVQQGRDETFLREYLINKIFWNYEFSAKIPGGKLIFTQPF